jgi:acetyl esterase/lipase
VGHRIEEAGGAAQVVVWPEMIHVFPAFPADLVPEAAECLTAAGAFLAQHLTTSQSSQSSPEEATS